MAGRNHTSLSDSRLRSNHHHVDDSISLHPHRRLTPTEVRIIEDRIAAQSREIQTILLDNQRLAATHVALKQDVAAAQQDLRRLSATASSVKAERDAQVREVYERSLKLEVEARSIDGLSAELDRVRANIKELRDERKELSEKLEDIEGDISRIQPELQEFSDLKTEIEAWHREIRRGRAAIEYERKMCSNNFELSEAMEKHKISITREAEKLRSELANVDQRAMAAIVDVSAANQGPEYAIHQSGYYGNSSSDPHVVHQVAVSVANQGPGYTIHQPGYGGYSLSDPHVVHPVALSVSNHGPGYAIHQPVGDGNSISDPHVVHPAALSVAIQGLGYAIHQPVGDGNSLSDPHVNHQIALSIANHGPEYAIHQPGDDVNSLSDPHVVHQAASSVANQGLGNAIHQPGDDGNLLSNPRAVRKGKRLNKKGKTETNTQGKKTKCRKCKKKHYGECLSGKGVCFKCKDLGHMAFNCPAIKGKEPEKEGKDQKK